ncbi:MAG: chlorosome envelope protein B [Chlorobiaceae bacterium]|nr:chlorosome envelope protein B [Chlorobiaceae bacterium]
MANETNNDFAAAVGNVFNIGGTLVQQSFELVSTLIKSVVQFIEPLGKSALDLLGNATSTLGQAAQSVTSAIAPKK